MNCVRCRQPVEENRKFCGKCGAPTANLEQEGDEPTIVPVRVNDVLDGKWRLERKLGEGGMGTVYLAHELQLDRKVAIKLLASSLAGDAELVTRFEREGRLTASLEHPNIVPVYAVGEVEGRPFIVMKKLEGRTLAAFLRERGPLSGEDLLALMRQLCSGLDFIHAKGCIHRDIKSGNIFIGHDGLATILDFGILRTSQNTDALTRTGMVMGTPQYMSPEQALGAREINHRADLYALAVLLFECLTGTLPFQAESELSLIQMHAHAQPPDVTERAPWVPKGVAEVVKRALAKRPEDRYASAGELLAALEEAFGARIAAPVTGSHPLTNPAAVPSGSFPAVGAAVSTLPSMKRLAALSSPALPWVTDRLTSPVEPSVPDAAVGSAAAVAPGEPRADGEPSGPRRSALAALAHAGRVPLVFGAAGMALMVGGYLSFGRWPSRRPPNAPVAQAGTNAASATAASGLALFDAGLDLREEQGTELAAKPATLAAAREPDGVLARAEGGSENAVETTSAVASQDSRARVGKQTSNRKPGSRGSGTLNLITTLEGEPYWASVSVDGVLKGNTPLLLDLPPGNHRVRFERAGFRAVNKQIKIASGRIRVLRVELIP